MASLRNEEELMRRMSLFSDTEMVKTKTTERKAQLICANCQKTLPSSEDFRFHVDICLMKATGCESCKKTFSTRKSYLQHIRRKHSYVSGIDKQSLEGGDASEALCDSDWEDQSECEVLEETENDVLSGRTFCKRTSPLPIPAPKKCEAAETVTRPEDCAADPEIITLDEKWSVEGATDAGPGAVRGGLQQEVFNNDRAREIKFVYRTQDNGTLRKHSVLVEDSLNGDLFSSSTSCKSTQPRNAEFCLGDILSDGNIDSKSVNLKLTSEGDVVVNFKYV